MNKINVAKIMRGLGISMSLLTLALGLYVLFGYTQIPTVCIAIFPVPEACLVPQYGYEYRLYLNAGMIIQIILALLYSGLALSEYVKTRTKVNKNEEKNI
jgi:hypothetical protein